MMMDMQKKVSRGAKLSEYFFYVFIFLLTICKAFGLGNDSILYRISFLLSLIFLFGKMISDRWPIKKLIILFGIFAIILVNYYITRRETLLLSFLIFIGIKDINLNSSLKVVFVARVIGFIGTILLAILGIIPNAPVIMWRAGSMILRYGWGFEHPNLLHGSFALLVILGIYLAYDKLNLIFLISICLLNYLVYTVSLSRTGFLLVNFLILCFFVVKYLKSFRAIFFWLVPKIQYLLLGGTLLLAIPLYSTPLVRVLDNMLTGRLYYSNQQLTSGISLFGKVLGKEILYDNSYSMMLSLYGVVISIIFFWCYHATAKQLVTQRNIRACLLMLMLSVYFFTESSLPSAMINYSIFFMAKWFFEEPISELSSSTKLY